MLKRISALLTAVIFILMMSAAVCSAAEESKMIDIRLMSGATASVEDTVKQLVYEQNSDKISGVDDVILESCETLSNGLVMFQYGLHGMVYSDVLVIEPIGDYEVSYGASKPFYILDGDKYIELREAYDRGLITDEIMDELVASNQWFKKAEAPTEAETKSTEPKPATVDQATPDTVSPGGPAIKTGVVFSGLVFLLMAESIIVVVVYRRKLNKIQ